MAMIFRWYFIHSQRLAQRGTTADRVNFQIHCGPAMAACNRWLAETPLADWRQRHVDLLADQLMENAAQILNEHFSRFSIGTHNTGSARRHGTINLRMNT